MSDKYHLSYVNFTAFLSSSSETVDPLMSGDTICNVDRYTTDGLSAQAVSKIPTGGNVNTEVNYSVTITYDRKTDVLGFGASCAYWTTPIVHFENNVRIDGITSGALFPRRRITTCRSNVSNVYEPLCNTLFGLNKETATYHEADQIIGRLEYTVAPYDMTFFYPDAVEDAGTIVGMMIVPRPVLLVPGLPGSQAASLSGGSASFSIKVNGGEVGQVPFSGTGGSFSFPNRLIIPEGGILVIEAGAPSPDLKNIAITIVGSSMIGKPPE